MVKNDARGTRIFARIMNGSINLLKIGFVNLKHDITDHELGEKHTTDHEQTL